MELYNSTESVKSFLRQPLVQAADYIITFNYDVALENELIAAQKFRAKNGYGKTFQGVWDEPDSEVTILKLHGSINWIAVLFGGAKGYGTFRTASGSGRSSTTWILLFQHIYHTFWTHHSLAAG